MKIQDLPGFAEGIAPATAMRRTVSGCILKNRAASCRLRVLIFRRFRAKDRVTIRRFSPHCLALGSCPPRSCHRTSSSGSSASAGPPFSFLESRIRISLAIGDGALRVVPVGVLARLHPALQVDIGAFLKVLADDLGQSLEAHHSVPFGALAALAGDSLFPALVGRGPQRGHRRAVVRGIPQLWIGAQTTNQQCLLRSPMFYSAIVYSLFISCYFAIHPPKAYDLPSKSVDSGPDGKRLRVLALRSYRSFCLPRHGTGGIIPT